jgi:hypothetical protein
MGENRNLYEILIRSTEEKDNLEGIGTGGRKMLHGTYRNKMGMCGLHSSDIG